MKELFKKNCVLSIRDALMTFFFIKLSGTSLNIIFSSVYISQGYAVAMKNACIRGQAAHSL